MKDEDVTRHQIQVLDIVNKLSSNKIVVLPKDRDLYLRPFAEFCYKSDFAFNTKGPQFYAMVLYLSFDFLISEDSKACMDVQMIDKELQKYRKVFHD